MTKQDDYLGALARRAKRDPLFRPSEKWHSEDVRLYPVMRQDFERPLGEIIREDLLPGHAPETPLLDEDDFVVTIGSCFARELRDHLNERGFSSGIMWVPAGLNNTFAILDFISWCVTGSESGSGFRYDRLGEGKIERWVPEGERVEYEARLAEAGAFVFTLGLAEVWEDKETGGVFWRGVPASIFDADRHVFRLTTVEENEQALAKMIELVRRVNPYAPIVLTLSPVPLRATFRGRPCITADCVSKSVLRVAIDRIEDRGLPGVYYWPSFEVVRWVGAHLPYASYGGHDDKARHPSRSIVAEIIDAFVGSYYTPEAAAKLRAAKVVAS